MPTKNKETNLKTASYAIVEDIDNLYNVINSNSKDTTKKIDTTLLTLNKDIERVKNNLQNKISDVDVKLDKLNRLVEYYKEDANKEIRSLTNSVYLAMTVVFASAFATALILLNV